ncbi:hypothetical protein [Ktedonobacter racemifer]|uniref:hypothetical protein n=1 Tax=Ktedonobacter racemifer TaxID=363277 RepID=UPI003B75BBE9
MLIKQQFGVRWHPAHCSCLLRAAKRSVQKTVKLAPQRNEGERLFMQTTGALLQGTRP